MWYIYLSTGFICISYATLISIFFVGWKRIPTFVSMQNEVITTELSVVVACRNEEACISELISCLAKQTFQDFELIFINDHSTDATRHLIKTAQATFPKIQLIDAVGNGKKNALQEGIHKSTGELIITTDADCSPSFNWLETIAKFYKSYPSDLIICPVKLSGIDKLLINLQILEFTSLIASGAGAAGAGMPILCNGANLVFTKNNWLDSQADLHAEEQSGDDMFLLESTKKRGATIQFLKSESAFVISKPSSSWREFIKQRRRWTSKSTAYTDWQIIFTACVVMAINLLIIILFSLSIISSSFIIVFLSLILFKYVLDSIFLNSVSKFFQLNNIWIYSLLLSVIYPFYIVFTAFSTFLIKPTNWK